MVLLLTTLLFFRCRKKEGDLTNALAQWRNIESALISKDAEYSKLLSENRNLSGAFSDLQNQLENVRMSTNHSQQPFSTSVMETCVCADGGCSVRYKEPANL